jgi:hypothetical protein
MSNRVRYYITESDNQPVVRTVPVTVSAQPRHDLMEIERRQDAPVSNGTPVARTPVGRIVKVLRKPSASRSS